MKTSFKFAIAYWIAFAFYWLSPDTIPIMFNGIHEEGYLTLSRLVVMSIGLCVIYTFCKECKEDYKEYKEKFKQ